MPVNLKGKHFLTLKDFTTEEIEYLLKLSRDFKNKKRAGIKGNSLYRKNIVLIFEKASTRTRCAFETAGYDDTISLWYPFEQLDFHFPRVKNDSEYLIRVIDRESRVMTKIIDINKLLESSKK